MKSIQKLFPFIKPYKLFMFLAPLLMALEVTMDLLQPYIMQLIIDYGIASNDMNYVVTMMIFSVICAIVGLIGGMGCTIYSTKAAVHFATVVRKAVFKKIANFSSNNRDQFGTGKLITILISDINIVQQALMMMLRVFVRGPLLFIGSVIIVFLQVRELFPILLVLIPILIFFIFVISNKSRALFQQVQTRLDRLNNRLQESIAGIRVIKSFVRSEYEMKEFQKVNQSLKETQIVAERFIMVLMPILLFFVNIGIVVALLLGVIPINETQIPVGKILAFINYLNIILMALTSSSHVLMQMMRAFPSASRIVEIINTDISINNRLESIKHPSIKGNVEFQNVLFTYPKSEKPSLQNISFSVFEGETLGIIGATGSGKTTLVKLLSRLYDPIEGNIFIDGINLKDFDVRQIRENIGFVTQKPFLFSGTIEQNIRYGKEEASKSEVEQATNQARADEFITKLKQNYQYELMQGATNLSGGQKQRLSIARAFIKKPAILILDDATSAVDANSEKMILHALKTDFQETTKIIISSKVSSIIHANKILVLNDGKLVCTGTHEQLLEKCDLYREIYETQVERGGVIVE